MKIKYINNKNDNKLYDIFVKVFNIYYKQYETSKINRLLIKDTIKHIDRIDMRTCKKFLGRIGIKGYYNLNNKNTKELLKNELYKRKNCTVLEFYRDNQIKLDCFKYEVIELLNISSWEFDKIKHQLKVSGTQVVNIGCKPKTVNKYDRRFIYEIKLNRTID